MALAWLTQDFLYGGGSSDTSSVEEATTDSTTQPPTDTGTESVDPAVDTTGADIPGPDVLPLLSSEGAEAGLKGCLNRALYFNGPHFVQFTESETTTKDDISVSKAISTDLIYTAIGVTDTGVTEFDIETTRNSTTSSTANFTSAYTLERYQLSNLGTDRASPIEYPFKYEFDIEVGESFSFELATGQDNAVSTIDHTYLGRETIEIAGQSVETCKVAQTLYQDIGDPSFNTTSATTIWYAVGTGLTLKTDAVSFPFIELDRTTTVRQIDSASINSITIF